MKKVTFALELKFDNKISPDELAGIARRVADAIKHEINAGMGIAPDGKFTTEINVFSPVYKINETIKLV